jgi:hypothetical protein
MVPSPSSVFFQRWRFLVKPSVADPDLIRIQSGHWIRRSGSRRAKTTNKKIEKVKKKSCFEVLIVLFLKASPVAWMSFMKA